MVSADNVDMSVYSLVEEMRHSKNIYEKAFGRVSSFNFTKQAFEKSEWDSITNKARGLYIDTVDYKIVARSYDKFFNINERPETKFNNLRYKLQFPVTVYVKENGFLGIVGWNPEIEDLLITSKSSPTGEFSGYLAKALYSIYGEETMQKIKDYIKEHEVSFVFECCDMVNDPHIIEYPESKVVLLDVIKNQVEYNKLPYNELVSLANDIGLIVKEKACEITSWEDFFVWYNEVTSEDYMYNGENIEGFVIEDSVGYMTKLKLHYYKFWKRLRGVAQSVLKHGNYKYTGSLLTPIENEFFGWCKSLFNTLSSEERDELRDKSYTNICSLRKMFFDWMRENNKEVQ
jgi:tRNA splicing ligase